ncbi:hypothetical protein E2C01_087620 [Portunus trituberculatus]|uniref:Uncharacterized protein n=1 Tax=Portunus trituberculatus TaxID=210409 RepID=A0A5B7JGV5_PORTR|nr:hypothetical protein [Portunus trituberculatus]
MTTNIRTYKNTYIHTYIHTNPCPRVPGQTIKVHIPEHIIPYVSSRKSLLYYYALLFAPPLIILNDPPTLHCPQTLLHLPAALCFGEVSQVRRFGQNRPYLDHPRIPKNQKRTYSSSEKVLPTFERILTPGSVGRLHSTWLAC